MKSHLQSIMNLSASRAFKDDLLYQNATVNALFLGKLNTAANRKRYPSANFLEWVPVDGVANLLKMWASGDNRPENGSFVGFRVEGKRGKVVFPQFY
jgi:hypothetical protein